MSQTILVTGATGKVGGRLVHELLARSKDVVVRVYARDTDKAAKSFASLHAGSRLQYSKGTLEDTPAFKAALTGADRLFLVYNDFDRVGTIAHLAKEAGVKHLVRISCILASATTDAGTPFQNHGKAEAAIAATGIPFTILRPHDFMENALMSAEGIKQGKVITYSYGQAALGSIAVKDIAASAAGVLLAPIELHAGIGYSLTGPEAITSDELAALFSKHLGTTIKYVDLDEATLIQTFSQFLPPIYALLFAQLGVGYKQHLTGHRFTTGWVKYLSGNEPTSWDAWLSEHKQAFQ